MPTDFITNSLEDIHIEINEVIKLLNELNEAWSKAYIYPIYKAGKRARRKVENDRPVSLTSVSCKILEHIIYSNIKIIFVKTMF